MAIPVGAALLWELGTGAESKGAIATGALFVGFPGLDAPARARAAWQAAVTPLVGIAAALGVLTGPSAPLSIALMLLVGAAAGYCFAVSLRFSIAGLSVALALVVSQGLGIPASHAAEALLFTALGGLLQAAFSLCVFVAGDREEEGGEAGWNTPAALQAFSANLTLRSTSARHALRFGSALAYGLLTVQYALFTAAITTYAVLLADTLGEPAWHAAGQRAIATAIGIAIAGASFLLWSNPGEEAQPLAPPDLAR